MHLVICGSMTASKAMLAAKTALEKLGHTVTLPHFTEHYARLGTNDKMHGEAVKNKRHHDLIRNYFFLIAASDAVLVVNPKRHGVTGYIGANTFLEMGFAHVCRKPIYLLYPAPPNMAGHTIGQWYADEIEAMQPTILRGYLSAIG